MKTFGTEGPVSPEKNYIVSRTAELTDLIERIKQGKYLVIFAPRQTGKTTLPISTSLFASSAGTCTLKSKPDEAG